MRLPFVTLLVVSSALGVLASTPPPPEPSATGGSYFSLTSYVDFNPDPKLSDPDAPKPTGFAAWTLRKVAGWDDDKIRRAIVPKTVKKTPLITSITDENYEGILWGEENRGKVLVLNVFGNTDVMRAYDEALYDVVHTNSSLVRQDEDVPGRLQDWYRFGRVEYLKEDIITTRWLIFKPPVVVVSYLPPDAPKPARGMEDLELRFFPLGSLPTSAHAMYLFLHEEIWRRRQPWHGKKWSPDGPRHPLLIMIGKIFFRIHYVMDNVPGYMWLIGSGALGNFALRWMHSETAKSSGRDTTKAKSDEEDKKRYEQLRKQSRRKGAVPQWGSGARRRQKTKDS